MFEETLVCDARKATRLIFANPLSFSVQHIKHLPLEVCAIFASRTRARFRVYIVLYGESEEESLPESSFEWRNGCVFTVAKTYSRVVEKAQFGSAGSVRVVWAKVERISEERKIKTVYDVAENRTEIGGSIHDRGV